MIVYLFIADRVEALKRIFGLAKRHQWQGLATILILYLVAASAYLAIVPPLEGFDAPAHMNAINYWRQTQSPPVVDLPTNQYSYELLTQPPLFYLLSAFVTGGLPAEGADDIVRASTNRYFPGLSTRQSIDLPNLSKTVAWAMFLARLVSLVGGLLTVLATWLWVRTLLPDERRLPTAVAAVVALNPLFLFSSTAITNDAWAAAGTVVVIWLVSATAARPQSSLWRWFFVGAVAGLAALTKYSVLLVALPALLILLQYRCYRPFGHFWRIAGVLFAGALLTAGWWYGRNFLLYGEPVPLSAMSTVITTLQRPELMPLSTVWTLLPFLFYSYWGLFLATFAPEGFFTAVQWAVLLALVGLPLWLWRRTARLRYARALWLALIWFLLNLVSMINYMRLISYGEQARFLLPSAPAIGLLLVVGWQGWAPVRFAPWLRTSALLFMLLLAFWPLPTLYRAYAQPPALTETSTTRPIDAHFTAGPRVVGYDLPRGAAVAPGGALPLTLYLTADEPIDGDYTLFLHLVDSEDRLLYQYDGLPFGGRHPTRQWQPGAIFADPYTITLPATTPTATLATLIVGFYAYEEPTHRLSVSAADGTDIGDRLLLGSIRIVDDGAPRHAAATPLATWASGIDLLQAVVEPATDEDYRVELTWRTAALMTNDYTVFLQFLNAEGAVVAQIDQQPQRGHAPTSTWLVDERITDTYLLTVPAEWHQLIVGLYSAQDGQRLPLTTAAQDYFQLQER